ncbi:MAG: CBS domain-containing protein [Balneolaceae bacterium]
MAVKEIKLIENAEDKGSFVQHVLLDLKALKELYVQDKFEKNNARIGAELELNFLDSDYYPTPIGHEIYESLKPKNITTEYARFNLEINSDPITFSGRSLSKLKRNLNKSYRFLQREAVKRDSRILLSGIIPTLNKKDISVEALTPEVRFKTLYDLRKELHGEHYEFNIRGVDELIMRDNLLLFAGCMTSFQLHLQVSPYEIISKYNWAQMISGPLLAAATCSPLFLGKKLWHETRIALFQQSADMRNRQNEIRDEQSRVNFGNEWVEKSILELFQEDISIYDPVFTCEDYENPFEQMEQGNAPELKAWNYFNGSVYRWNRVCYGVLDNKPSLRIENRILPTGPTMEDQIANAAFWFGMMKGMPEEHRNIHEQIPFDVAKHNFFKAAQLGLEVQFKWFTDKLIPADELILKELLPLAREGLRKANVDEKEAKHYLDIIHERVETGKTGSRWIMDSYDNLRKNSKQEEALVDLTSSMISRQESDKPVHTWEPALPKEAGEWKNRYNRVHKFMTTSLYKITEDTVVDLAAHVMEWKKIGNILVESEDGELVGVLNKDAIINFLISNKENDGTTTVGEIMISDPITAGPNTTLEEAIRMVLKDEISCLPIVEDKRVVGIVTKHDFVTISEYLISEASKE